MQVAFLHVGEDLRLPTLMARSARAFGYTLLQMTDAATPRIEGVHEVLRLPWDGKRLMTYRLRHLAQLDATPTCIVDTDILFRRDVSDVWTLGDFDIALTRREKEVDVNGFDIAQAMPYNTGVMFSRNEDFWKDALDVCASLPEQRQEWWGDQLAVKEAAAAYRVLELPVEEWNYSPSGPEDQPPGARVLHYKGKVRKDWMR